MAISFNDDELDRLCFDLGLDYDNFLGPKDRKITGIISYMERNGVLYKLVDYCRQKRPEVDWFALG